MRVGREEAGAEYPQRVPIDGLSAVSVALLSVVGELNLLTRAGTAAVAVTAAVPDSS